MSADAVAEKPSPVEAIKENSRNLRGTIAADLTTDSDHFGEAEKTLIKFHGFYQQDDRDARKDRNRAGGGKAYNFMVRCKIPGGRVSADQYLAVDRLADLYANGTLRVTSRQGFQFHGVLKSDLKATLRAINDCLLTTLGACGDVSRNVMAPAAPFANAIYREMQRQADLVAAHLAPRTGAYHEIWLNGEALPTGANEPEGIEPIYGKVYLPRKFKAAFATPDDNSTDIYAQDLSFVADVKDGEIVGYDLYAGGGMGMTHGNALTFPFLAQAICYVQPDQVVAAAEATIKLFRDHGNRSDRKRARLKYVLAAWGIDKFRETFRSYLPFALVLPKIMPIKEFPLHLGWNAQGDGRFFYGIHVQNGRIKDADGFRLRSALRMIVERFRPEVRLTPMQDVILAHLPADARPTIEAILAEHGVALPGVLPMIQQHSMACPAIPTCGLALAEAERALPGLVQHLSTEIDKLGLSSEKIGIRMTGCPNGCVRPYQSDIGIVGRSGDKYTLFVGGNLIGSRLSFVLKDLVPYAEIVPTLTHVLTQYRDGRTVGESFSDYCCRTLTPAAAH